jgi:hypothetical protein
MNKEFIPYELALELKELGFDEYCFAWYDSEDQEILNYDNTRNSCGWLNGNDCTAPTYSQAFRFFREKYGLNSHIHQEKRNNYSYCCGQGYSDEIDGYQDFDTYEEAELACLKKLIEIVKGGNK